MARVRYFILKVLAWEICNMKWGFTIKIIIKSQKQFLYCSNFYESDVIKSSIIKPSKLMNFHHYVPWKKFRMTWTSLMLLVKIVTQGRRKTRKICILRSTRGKHSAPKNEKKIGRCLVSRTSCVNQMTHCKFSDFLFTFCFIGLFLSYVP